jgi:glycosyltransferase involved in cell wall biosynthesis
MRILHISADFPDPLAPAKTRAVANLLALAPEHEHRVWSINRVGWRHGIHALDFGEGHRAVAYGAPPRGVRLAGGLARLADFILEDAARAGVAPDAVHAHKLSVEGLVGARVAQALGVPLLVSSQGNSDLKIIGARPDLRPRWRRIWRAAAAVFPFAPWTADGLARLLGPREGPVACLPCPTPEDRLLPPRETGPVMRTAFHLAGHVNKRAVPLMRAVAAAAREVPDLRLEIAGGGGAEAFATLSEAAARIAPGRARLLGPRPHGEMPALFNASAACPMPSRRESYGMALAEALMAGCPVLWPRGAAIDGYFEDGSVGLAVDASDDAALAAGLARLARDEAAFKARLARMQETGGLAVLQRDAIAATYRDALDRPGAPFA